MSGNPKWMEEVADAGGWDEHAKLKAQQELMEKMDKIPPEKFLQLNSMLGSLERLLDSGGSDLGILKGMTDTISDTVQTELKGATAELLNMLNTTINTLLEPFMPLIQAGITTFNTLLTRGTNAIQAMIEGKFDQYLKNLKLEMQDEVDAWQKDFTEAIWASDLGRAIIDSNLAQAGLPSSTELEASALAGGIYSGQFDLVPDTLADMLANMNIPTFDEEM